jgi:hypothetical protein
MIKWFAIGIFAIGVYIGVMYQEVIMRPFEQTPTEKWSEIFDSIENEIEFVFDEVVSLID